MSSLPPADNRRSRSSSQAEAASDSSAAEGASRPRKAAASDQPAKQGAARNVRSLAKQQLLESRSERAKELARKQAEIDSQVIDWLSGTELAEESRDVTSQKSTNQLATKRTDAGHDTAPQVKALADDAILANVGARLAERGVPSFTRLGLDVKSGVLTVHGTVASKGEHLLLMRILQTTAGVTKVNDGLVVGRSAASAPPPSSSSMTRTSSGSLSIPSPPSMPSLPSMSTLLEAFKERLGVIPPAHAGAVLACLVLIAYLFWPRAVARPVAVYPVKGKIVLEGEPLADATIVLHPVGSSKLPNGLLPRGTSDAEGRFVIKTFEQADGAPEGDFVATVHICKLVLVEGDMVPGPDESPIIYRSTETSPFRLKITRETKEISLLELKKTGEK